MPLSLPNYFLDGLRVAHSLVFEHEYMWPPSDRQYDDRLDAILSPSILSLVDLYRNERHEMNEIIDAIEAMIRRIVKEELATAALNAPPVQTTGADTNSMEFVARIQAIVDAIPPTPVRDAAFGTRVREALTDQPWFDDIVVEKVNDQFERSWVEDKISDLARDAIKTMDFEVNVS